MRHVILGTAGHVDHGKTALIKALTQIDCDSHKEEKERGITINLGFAHMNLPSGESVGIVDVPGHKDFIKTMVAGAFGIDIVLLVIAADSGIMPQTKEHFRILELLGVANGIVVITKKDLVDEEMLELVQLEVAELLEGSSYESAPVVKVSSLSGEGLDELIMEISIMIPRLNIKKSQDLFRMYIDRVFNVKGIGYVVTGSVLGGQLETGSILNLLPGKGKQFKVRAMERHGIPIETIVSGDRAALNLSGFKMEDYQRGMVLSDQILDETALLDATFKLFSDEQMGLWSKVIFYSGTFESTAKVHVLNKDGLEKDEMAIVQIHLEKPAVLLNKDKFILRNSSNDMTLGGGVIIDTKPLHHRRRTPKLIQVLTELSEATLNSDQQFNMIKIELKKAKTPVFSEELAEALKLQHDELLHECDENNDGTVIVRNISGKNIIISSDQQIEYEKTIISMLQQHHETNFLIDEGLDVNELIGKLGLKTIEAAKMYIPDLLDTMKEGGSIRKVGNTWSLVTHQVTIDKKTQQQIDWLEKNLLGYNSQIPLNKELEAEAYSEKINRDNLKLLLKYLVHLGKIRASEGEYIHTNIVEEVKRKLMPVLVEKERGINEKEFRLLFDSTKNFVKTMIRILVDEGLITKSEFYIHITEKGKDYYKK
ncbi:MAG: selenocysteine-specific translation elongation factor [Marinilabiliales bacterium]|nr:MAG: selenocysteine-specific translation elongation factor [Marinilabiliales bacterium]